MAGYSRQSAASIVPTAVVRATPLNDEFNTLRDAFVVATGHKHDGTSTEGAYVPLISDTNSRNKVVVDSANNRISLFINVSSAAVEQLRLIDGAILPVTDNDIDLGSSSFEFKDLFIDGTANIDSLVADTAAISGGTINSAVIGGTTPAAGTFTTITATVSATIPSVAITGGTINNTIIGATTPAAGTFTNLTVNTAATIASAAISAGTINNTVIGGTTPQAITGTIITANTGFVGALTGNVTGNVTASSGTSTFNNATVNGTLSATLTGNVNASSGTSTFNNVTISGTLNMDGATAATITNLSSPVNNSDAATKLYVDTSISNLVNSAPGTLDTLNELASALGNDPSFATTVTNSIATKLSLSGGTMTGAIAMGTNKITGMGDPTNAQDAATKTYVDTQRDTRLALSGGTMSGAIAMGTNKITGLGDPTANQDAATKIYVDGILGSATSAAASAAAAATSASNAATSASNASTSATNAASSASASAASAAAAAASYDSFDDRYLGVKTSDPSLDNDGNALVTGAIYFNSTAGEMRVWTGSAWASTLLTTGAQTFTGVKTFASNPILDAGTANGVAYLNGSKVLTTGSALTFDGTTLSVANGVAGGTSLSLTGSYTGSGNVNLISFQRFGGAVAGALRYSDDNPFGMMFGTTTSHAQIFMTANTERMRISSAGDVGIGTSSPSEKLTVAGNIKLGTSGTTYIYGPATTGRSFLSNSDSTAYIGIYGSAYGAGSNSIISFVAGTTNSMTFDSSGNLGLGVTPSAWESARKAIQLSGTASYFAANSVAVIAANNFFDGQNKYIGIGYATQYAQSAGQHIWLTAPSWNGTGSDVISFTQAMTLDASGNLGVTETSPSTFGKFVVKSGTINLVTDTASQRRLSFWSTANGNSENAYIQAQNDGGTTNTGEILFATKNAGGTLAERLRIAATGAIGLSGANYGTSGQVLTSNGSGSAPTWQNASGSSQWTTSGSNIYYNTGNVGIGTASPSYPLHVSGSGATSGAITSSSNAAFLRISAGGGFDNRIDFTGTLALKDDTAGLNRMYINSSGNVGIGTSSPSSPASFVKTATIADAGSASWSLNVGSGAYTGEFGISSSGGWIGTQTASPLRFITNGSERARITSDGDVGIGNSSPQAKLHVGSSTEAPGYGVTSQMVYVNGTSQPEVLVRETNSDVVGSIYAYASYVAVRAATVHPLVFFTSNSERARFTSDGYFKASNAGTYTYTASMHEFRQNAADYVLTLTNSNASPTGLQIYQITDANGTGNNFVDCYAGNTYRFQVRSNGGIANYSGNNVNLSDRREKANFAPAKSYLDTICAIPVQTFNYIDQSEDDPGLTLGVVAQDVQAVAPELVMESNWGTAEDPKMRLSIYQTDLQYALMKCIQELKAQNDELRQRVAALEAK